MSPEVVDLPSAPAASSFPATIEQPFWPSPTSSGSRAWLVRLLVAAILFLCACVLATYYVGAQGGVDQAGYLMAARLLAGEKNVYAPAAPAPTTAPAPDHPQPSSLQTASLFDPIRNRLSFIPETPFQFVSRMCIITEPFGPPPTSPAATTQPANYRVYAKYPFGYPLIAAAARLFFGFPGMYMINPLCTLLACLFGYLLFRQVVSPFLSLIGTLFLACNPLVLFYANDANSHSSTLFCITLGFWGLLSFLRTRESWRAWIGGLALGYACTIRYSEFLLVLPILFAAAIHFRWNAKRAWGALSLMLAWAIPVAALAFICWISFGAPWKTGYSYCRESTGFAWKYFTGQFGDTLKQGNWETFLQQLNHNGLFLLWPLAIAGLLAMIASSWRLGVTLALWVLPQTILYMFYYWAPSGENTISYLRFFMTIMPGLILAALWLIAQARFTNRTAIVLAAGALAAIGCAMNLRSITPQLESLHTQSVGLRATIDNTRTLLPQGSVLFADDNILNQFDCVGGWKLVNSKLFTSAAFFDAQRRVQNIDKDDNDEEDPDPMQHERSRFYMELLGRQDAAGAWMPKTGSELQKIENDLIDRYFAEGRRVAFLVIERDNRGRNVGRGTVPNRKDCQLKELGRWVTQPPIAAAAVQATRRGNRPPRPQGIVPARFGGCYVLYELVKKPK